MVPFDPANRHFKVLKLPEAIYALIVGPGGGRVKGTKLNPPHNPRVTPLALIAFLRHPQKGWLRERALGQWHTPLSQQHEQSRNILSPSVAAGLITSPGKAVGHMRIRVAP